MFWKVKIEIKTLLSNIHSDSGFWRNAAERDLSKMLDVTRFDNRAKNVVIFIGDGMGLQTHAMARIFKVKQNIDGNKYSRLGNYFLVRANRQVRVERRRPWPGRTFPSLASSRLTIRTSKSLTQRGQPRLFSQEPRPGSG